MVGNLILVQTEREIVRIMGFTVPELATSLTTGGSGWEYRIKIITPSRDFFTYFWGILKVGGILEIFRKSLKIEDFENFTLYLFLRNYRRFKGF
eukprot:UN26563